MLPAGKHKGLTQSQAFEKDLAYCILMAQKTSLSSPWARNCQNYAIARLRATARAKLLSTEERDSRGRASTAKSGKWKSTTTCATRGYTTDEENNEWRGTDGGEECHREQAGIDGNFIVVGQDERRDDGGREATSHDSQGTTASRVGQARRSGGADQRARRGVSEEGSSGDAKDGPDGHQEGTVQQTKALCSHIDGRIREIERGLNELSECIENLSNSKYRLPQLDVLEIGPGGGNAVGNEVKKQGGRALSDAPKDIYGTKPDSFEKLWKIGWRYEPKHIWIDARLPWKMNGGTGSKELNVGHGN